MPNSHRAEPHVEVRESDPEQTQPRPKHVPTIETTDAGIGAIESGRLGKLIEKSSHQVSQRVTTKGVAAEKHHVDCQNNRAEADAEGSLSHRRIGKPHRFPNVVREDENKNEREI